jgi:hypothetical protein
MSSMCRPFAAPLVMSIVHIGKPGIILFTAARNRAAFIFAFCCISNILNHYNAVLKIFSKKHNMAVKFKIYGTFFIR